MRNEAATCDVEYPIFGDSGAGAGVEGGLDFQVKADARVGDFDEEVDVLGLRVVRDNGRAIEVEGDDVGYEFVCRVVFWANVDWLEPVRKTEPIPTKLSAAKVIRELRGR